MVATNNFEEPNLSYVRVNQSTSPGTGESIKCHITKNMSPTDPAVVNSQLLHRSMVDQPVPPQEGTTTLWRPAHLYTEQEKAQARFKFDTWEQLPRVESEEVPIKVQVVVNKTGTTVSPSSNKRPLENSDQNSGANKKLKLNESQVLKPLLQRNIELEKNISQMKNTNAQLVKKNRDLEQRMELMSRILRNPQKLAALMRKLNEGKPTNATGTVCT